MSDGTPYELLTLLFLRCHLSLDQYMDGIKAFREVRRALPKENIFNIQYEDMLDENMRLSILKRLLDFVGASGVGDMGSAIVASGAIHTKAAPGLSLLTYAVLLHAHMQG